MKTHILHIEQYDDSHSIIDKMNWAKSDRILMVFPRRQKLIFRKLDILLLQRHSESLGAKIAFVCKNFQINNYAYELNIPVFRSLRQARNLPWESAISSDPEIFKIKEREISLEDLKKKAQPEIKYPMLSRLGPRLLFLLIGLFSFIVLLAALIPTVEIKITPKLAEQEIVLDLSANPNTTNFSTAGILPAIELSVTVEGRDTVKPSGSMTVPQQAASGEVQFTNLTDIEIIIPNGTIVRTSGDTPTRFITQTVLILEAESGAIGIVEVQAMNPGTSSNLPEESLNVVEGDLGILVSVINNAPTNGGSEIERKAPTQADYDRLSAKLEEALLSSAIQEAATRIGEDDLLIIAGANSFEVLEEIFFPAIPQPVAEVSLQLQIEYQILYIPAEALKAVGNLNLDATLHPDKLAINETISVLPMTIPEIDQDGQVYWQALAQRTIYPIIEDNEVRELIKGETVDSAIQLINENYELENPPELQLNPKWWPILPYIPLRIIIISTN